MTTTMPGVSTSVANGGLGTPAVDNTGVCAKIGTSTAGTANQPYLFAGNAAAAVTSALGDGTLPDDLRNHLLRSEGKPTLALKGSAATVGSNGTVTQSGSGPLPVLVGTAYEDAELKILIVAGGAVGTATFKLSLDGGRTYQPTRTTAASYVVGNGTSITFTAGTYVAGESYAADLLSARNSVANIGTALTALINSPYAFGFAHVLGHPVDAAALATLVVAVDASMAGAPLMGKFPAGCIVEAPPVDPALIVTALAPIAAPEVVVCGGFAQIYDDADKQIEKVNIARAVASRVARNPISIAASRMKNDSDLEALTALLAIYPAGATGTDGYLDSFYLPALNNARLTTLMTYPGRTGYYTCNVFTLSPLGSDFLEFENKRIISRAREVLYFGALRYIQARIRRNPSTGFIEEAQAGAIDRDLEKQLRVALMQDGHATGVKVVTNRNDNLASDPTLRMKSRIVAVTRARTIEVEVGLAVAL
jgi:hypothetical protein